MKWDTGPVERGGRPLAGSAANARSAAPADSRRASTFRAAHEFVEHGAPRRGQIAAVVAAAAETHDAPVAHLVREGAEAAGGVRVRLRGVLQVRERVARDAVRAALEDDEIRLVCPQV